MSYRSDVSALEERREALRQEIVALREPLRAEEAARAALREVEEALASRRALLPRLRAPQVRSACEEPWSGMRGSDTQRRCDRCKKDVFNLSAMSDTEVALLLASPGEACGRFYVRPDETVVTADCARGPNRSGLAVLAGSVLVGGALTLGALMPRSPHYVMTVPVEDVVASMPARSTVKTGEPVRVRGRIVPGSLSEVREEAVFDLAGDDPSARPLRVHYAGILPDGAAAIAKLGEPIIVEGAIRPSGTFEATFVLVHHLRQGYLIKDHEGR